MPQGEPRRGRRAGTAGFGRGAGGTASRGEPRVDETARLRAALLRWYRRSRRDLPWRRTRDPYAIWVSEVLLQQTTVGAALPRYSAFLARFPDVEALAAAEEAEVLAEWSGLGYYSRARNLSRAARAIVARGGFPRTAEELRTLPGVGPYTAAAVASIAFDEPVPCLDGNVVRVLSRVLARSVEARSGTADARIGRLAASLVVAPHAGERNQALMELGATVCRPRQPGCPRCPLRSVCRARALGRPERFPVSTRPEAEPPVRLAVGVAVRKGLLVLVPDAELVRGHLALPSVRVGPGESEAAALRRRWPALTGARAGAPALLGGFHHSVLTRRYRIRVFLVLEAPGSYRPAAVTLVRPGDLGRVPHGGALRKALDLWRRRTAGAAAPTPRGGGRGVPRARPRRRGQGP